MTGSEASPAGGNQEGSTVDLAYASATVEAASILTTPAGMAVPTNGSSTEQTPTQTITMPPNPTAATAQVQVTQSPPPAAAPAGVPAQVVNVQDATVLAAQAMVQAQANSAGWPCHSLLYKATYKCNVFLFILSSVCCVAMKY